MMSRWMDMAVDISVRAVKTVATTEFGRKEIDIKRYIRIEKVRMCILEALQALQCRFPVAQWKIRTY